MDKFELLEMCGDIAERYDGVTTSLDLKSGNIYFYKDEKKLKTQVNTFVVLEDCVAYFGLDVEAELAHILLQELHYEITGESPFLTEDGLGIVEQLVGSINNLTTKE